MKKLILFLFAGMMALGAVAQSDTFTVKGTFDWKKDSVTFTLVPTNKLFGKQATMSKTRAITGEMLEVTFNKLRGPAMLYLVFNENGRQSRLRKIPVIPGEILELYRDEDNITRKRGSQFYVDYNEAEKSIEAPFKTLTNFISEYNKKLSKGVPEAEARKEYDKKYPGYFNAYMNALTRYVKAHPDQEASAAIIATTITETNTDTIIPALCGVADLLTERVQRSSASELIKSVLDVAFDKFQEEARQEQAAHHEALVGSMAPDFTLMDINGKPLALSSLRGKWVILDFWGSWCVWCIKGMPKMKEYYAKYSDKLEILGVDCNDTVEKWKAAVAQHELPWLHVFWDKDDVNSDDPTMLYSVGGFPTKVIIDPEGKVAKIIVGENPAFYDYLDEVLK